ncbi:flagellar hook-length control protein FliK [Orrella dioscoreae]|uniref:flagellar hook-length control protein FliK n=1 Tax=Orrella dioscoreae TaxID=1851544 RepID=UPI000BF18892|nr:flagellar hook-length control protein FliK [Orrella dioscoreae]
MSVGSSALGTLLVQRLDAVLGTTLAQHANLINGARPDALAQAAAAARLLGPDVPGSRTEKETLERTRIDGTRGSGRGAGQIAGQDDDGAVAGRMRHASTASTPSAPTSLGMTARTILALLSRYPDPAPPATGKAPLWSTPAQAGGAAAPAAAAPGAQGSPAPRAEGQPAAPQGGASATAATQQAAPALAQAPSAALLARALAQALDGSGLFYESHLAALAFGKRTPAQLQAEPQARLHQQNPQPDGQRAGDTAGRPAADTPQATQAGATLTASGVHPDSAMLVRQQLEVLANQMVSWRGEAWPDAPMWWEVGRDAEQGASPEQGPAWSSRLVLELPTLGRVEAHLQLAAGNQLVMRLAAPDSASRLQEASELLRNRYEAAGFALTHFSVDANAADAPSPEPSP